MRVLLYSDLHTEFADFHPPKVDADVVVLAGDIGLGTKAVEWAKRSFELPTLLVAGNHEFYGGAIPRTLDEMQEAAAGSQVHVLERDDIVLGGVRFLGTTLWTDYRLLGEDKLFASANEARERMNDYKKIRRSPPLSKQFSKLRPEDTRKLFFTARNWLDERITASQEPCVVITHHAPSMESVPEQYREHLLSPAFASNLDAFIEGSGALAWMHGHTHHCVDYVRGSTRVVSNQRGYPDEPVEGWDPSFIVELPSEPRD
jgi:Icc-related predicted phosphoesterase